MKKEQKDLLRKDAKQHRDACADRRQLAKIHAESNLSGLAEDSIQAANDHENIANTIEAALKEVERGRWIPLSERKPEENQYVLLWSPGPWLRLAYWSSFVGSEATHWMLPQEDPNEPNEAA